MHISQREIHAPIATCMQGWRDGPVTALRAAAASPSLLRTPSTLPHATAPSPVAGMCARRPKAAVTAVTCDHGPAQALPMAGRWRAMAAAQRHLHLRERAERGWVSRGRCGRGVGVAPRLLQCEATAAAACSERVRARAAAARTPRQGSLGGRWRGQRRCRSRRRRGRGGRPPCRRRRRRSRATWRFLRGANGAVSSRQMGRERAIWAPS